MWRSISDRVLSALSESLLTIGGVTAFIGAPGILLWQAYIWLRSGSWPPLEFRIALRWLGRTHDPSTGWFGANKLITWIFDEPLCVGVFVIGVGIMAVGALFRTPRR